MSSSEDEEVEKKFADGMLTKMSKITDLISKLDSFANGEDQSRVKKPFVQTRAETCFTACFPQ